MLFLKDICYLIRNLFNTLLTVCFMHVLSIYDIKRICHNAQVIIISYGSFQDLTNLPNEMKELPEALNVNLNKL